jgi:hypothetical protein
MQKINLLINLETKTILRYLILLCFLFYISYMYGKDIKIQDKQENHETSTH